MLTPQEVTSREFDKAVFGGYDISSVDKFLEAVSQDYAALYRDNAILKNKLKVLVDKIEEYRSTEDAMRLALLSANKTARSMTDETDGKCQSLLAEAQEKADALLVEAQEKADALLAEAQRSTEERRLFLARSLSHEEEALEAAKQKTVDYLQALQNAAAAYQESLTHIYDFIPIPTAAETPAEETVPAAEPEPELVGSEVEPQLSQPPVGESAELPISVDSVAELIQRSFSSADHPSPAPSGGSSSIWSRIDFNHLQFGQNHNNE